MSAYRVSDPEVRQILVQLDSNVTDLTPYIIIAENLVTNFLVAAGNAISGSDKVVLTESELKEIERWLAAHFAAVADPRLKSQSVDGASESYDLQTDKIGLGITMYGKTAMMLDRSNQLSRIGRRIARVKTINPVLNKDESDNISGNAS